MGNPVVGIGEDEQSRPVFLMRTEKVITYPIRKCTGKNFAIEFKTKIETLSYERHDYK